MRGPYTVFHAEVVERCHRHHILGYRRFYNAEKLASFDTKPQLDFIIPFTKR